MLLNFKLIYYDGIFWAAFSLIAVLLLTILRKPRKDMIVMIIHTLFLPGWLIGSVGIYY